MGNYIRIFTYQTKCSKISIKQNTELKIRQYSTTKNELRIGEESTK